MRFIRDKMSGSRENIRIGQTVQYLSSRDEAHFRKKKSSPSYFAIPFVILFAVTCVAFAGVLYYLDGKWNAEIENFNERVTQELGIYDKNIKAKFEEYDNQIKQLRSEIAECKDKNKSPLYLGGDIIKFKGVTIQNVEEYPLIEDIQPYGLLDISIDKTNNTRMEDPLGRINSTQTSHKKQIELFKKITALLGENATVLSPSDVSGDEQSVEREDNEDSEETMHDFHVKEMTEPQGRQKRSTELAPSGEFNLIDTSPEVFDRDRKSNQTEPYKTSSSHNRTISRVVISLAYRSNQTEPHKTSSSHNRTIGRVGNPECNGKSSEEPSKPPINERLLKMKNSTTTRNASLSAALETEEISIDITETRRTVIAAHFGADSSKYNTMSHRNYEGNSYLRHPTGEYEDWRASPWFEELSMGRHFTLMNGSITVHSSGLYFVYAQILYNDLSDVNGYAVYLNGRVVLQCVTTIYSLKNVANKPNSCFTGGVMKCNAADKIYVKTIDPEKRIMLEATRSFVGLFKIGEFQSVK